MTLQFQPPPDWLAQEYVNRKNPVVQALESAQSIIQTYANSRLKQQQQAAANRAGKVNEFKSIADYVPADQVSNVASQYGINIPPESSQPPMVSTGTVTPVEMNAQQSLPQEHPAELSPLIQASLDAGHPDHLGLGSRIPTSKAGLAKYNSTLEAQGKLKRLSAGPAPDVPVMTHEAALLAGHAPRGTILAETPTTNAQDQKYSNEQDRLEQQAIDRLSRLRGDQSLARTENQRDAAIQAYNTIDRVKNEGRDPSQLEYYDILGQMWKARTGSSPTDQAIRDLDAKTFKGSLGKAYQYFSGKPAGVTTPEILQNIQDFAADSGLQSDKFHEAYMGSHKIKPSGLEEKRWQPLFNSHRGMSFVEGTGYKPGAKATPATAYSDPDKEARYQAWKAKQGKP